MISCNGGFFMCNAFWRTGGWGGGGGGECGGG